MKHDHPLGVNRFGSFSVKYRLFSWRVIVEDICFNEYTYEEPLDVDLLSVILRIARDVMRLDGIPNDHADYARAVTRLYYILCAADTNDMLNSPEAVEALVRFRGVVKSSKFDLPGKPPKSKDSENFDYITR
ncbi:hypothetical protein H2200_007465 [Cladophialophora chaetospira]|uniref:Uncharacterized protein n=1 Tax=Cladophialophora chaetospira TaxID=386627 RepID=A0AA38X7V4_9EURO|nr:hypothetical protein H2200_007465 [Cladophialophora chaetospira]